MRGTWRSCRALDPTSHRPAPHRRAGHRRPGRPGRRPARPRPVAQPPASAPTARVWVTTPDGTQRLAPATGATFRPGGSDQLTITVDPSRRYQTMRGFGASITDSSAVVLYRLPPHARDAVMADLFDPRKGDSLNVLRQPMGASDFVAGDHYTYDDVPAGQTDYAMKHFSIAHDRKQILPLLRQALRLNRDLTVVATPWSPPAWMKTNGSLIGGRLIDDPEIYRAYARYFVKFVQAYREAGVPVHAVTLQNEPQNRNPSGYPGADMPAWQQAKLAAVVGAAFDAARLDTLILGYDHNWSEHPNDIATTPPGEDPETDYPYRLLRSPQKRVVRRHRLPLLRRRAGRPDQAARRVPRHRDLVHRVLRLARPDRPAGAGVLRHPEVAQPQPGAGSHPQLGLDRRQLEPRARPERRPAQRRLRHLHRRGHRRPGAHGHPQRGVLHARAPRALRPARRAAHRQHVVRHHRLERPGDGRRVPQPGRVDGPGGAQRERRPAVVRGRPGRSVVRLHAAGRLARDVRLAEEQGAGRRLPPARPARRDGHVGPGVR